MEIGKQKTGRIAHATVGIGHTVEYLVGDADLTAIVRRRNPKPQDIGTKCICNLLR